MTLALFVSCLRTTGVPRRLARWYRPSEEVTPLKTPQGVTRSILRDGDGLNEKENDVEFGRMR